MANLDDSFNCAPAPAKVRPSFQDVIDHLKFGPPKEVQTKVGPRITREAKPSPEFFEMWQDNPEPFRSQGYTLSRWPKDTGPWKVTKWEKVPEKLLIQRENDKVMSRATDSDVALPCPEGLAYMPFQRAGIVYAYSRANTLIGDEQGLGKTIQAVGVLNCMLAEKPDVTPRVLVITPASLKLNWRRELQKWLIRQIPIFVADSKMCPSMLGVTVINYDVLHRHETVLHGTEWDLVVCDEAHLLKGGNKTRRAKMVFGIEPTAKQAAAGVTRVPGIRAVRKVLMTGTPIANKPAELFPLISYLDPVRWSNFFKFGVRYCAGNNYGGHWDFTGASNLGELQEILRSSILIRRLKKDVLTELPAKRRAVIELEATGDAARVVKAQRQQFAAAEDQMAALEAKAELAKAGENEDDWRDSIKALNVIMKTQFEAMATIRRENAIAKIPQGIEHLRELLDEQDGPIVVMAHHHQVSDALMKEFGDIAVLHRGDLSLEQKDEAVRRFQGMQGEPHDPKVRLFIGSIQASGVGITLTRASLMVFFEEDWVPGNVMQAEDRIHRMGQRESVLIQHLVLEGSIDAIMAKRIIAKQEIIEQALDKTAKVMESPLAGATEATTREKIAEEAASITPEEIAFAHEAMRILAQRCDGALGQDGMGFNKLDSAIGKSLAAQSRLTPRQGVLARKIAHKYRRQLTGMLPEEKDVQF